MLKNLKIMASRATYTLYRASTKITAVFFTATVVTVAGGAYAIFSGNGTAPPGAYNDERFPASISEAKGGSDPRKKSGFGKLGIPSMGGALPSMPADYADRANAQPPPEAPVMPVSVIQPEGASQTQALNSVSGPYDGLKMPKLAEESESTSTSTSTDTKTAPTAMGSGPGTNTSTSTATAASTEPVYFTLSANSGWSDICQKITMQLWNATYALTATSSPLAVYISSSSGSLYSDNGCASLTTTATISAGSSSISFYYKSTATSSAVVRADYFSLSGSLLTFTVGTPTAELVLGQTDFTSNTLNSGGLSAKSLRSPNSSTRVGDKLILADYDNHRVLIWNSAPTVSFQAADVVLGQPDATTAVVNNGGISASSLFYPSYVHSDGTRLFVVDQSNHRVLVWNSIPTANNTAADFALGQPTTSANTVNNGGISAQTMSSPSCAFTDESRLLVCDSGNQRVLIWNSIPTSSGEAANTVVGQTTMASSTNGSGAAELDGPYFAIFNSGRLLVSDFTNNRVLIWNSIPTTNGQSAGLAVGQTSTTTNSSGLSATELNGPGDLRIDDNGRLIIADLNNSRVLLWNSVPTGFAATANGVIGQSSFTAGGANAGGISSTSLNEPWGLDVYGDELWVSDLSNHRVLQYTLP